VTSVLTLLTGSLTWPVRWLQQDLSVWGLQSPAGRETGIRTGFLHHSKQCFLSKSVLRHIWALVCNHCGTKRVVFHMIQLGDLISPREGIRASRSLVWSSTRFLFCYFLCLRAGCDEEHVQPVLRSSGPREQRKEADIYRYFVVQDLSCSSSLRKNFKKIVFMFFFIQTH